MRKKKSDWGGTRQGAGRPATGRSKKQITISVDYDQVMTLHAAARVAKSPAQWASRQIRTVLKQRAQGLYPVFVDLATREKFQADAEKAGLTVADYVARLAGENQ